ncbi:alpha/beta hydrolase [Streptomyces sp. NPDC046977]|uniref:alpha/beta hydrolase n=1 Tax=Streptomyces sp. NPDC046977 TaxID=3154703 RepID=UPI0033CA9708
MTAARTTGPRSGPCAGLPSGSTSRRTPRRLLAVLGACTVLLTACAAPARTSSAPRPAPTGSALVTDDTTAVAPRLRPYYGQRLAWRSCDQADGFQCTTMRVPLDYAHPEAGDIMVSATRKRSTGGGRLGSLQLNPGGPGASAMDYLWKAAKVYSSSVRGAYDLVAMDPRGVGHSTLVDCGRGRPVSFMQSPVPPTPDRAEINAWDTMFRKTAGDCERHVGGLLPYVGTPDAARDMDMLRSLLGDRRLHYAGFSYGTYLGATYAELFPSRVGRVVLDGALDPALDAFSTTLHQARGYQVAWEAFAADCASRPDCPVGRSLPVAARALDTLRADLDRAPLRQGKDDEVTGDDLTAAVVDGLRFPAWGRLREALRGLRTGDTHGLQEIIAAGQETTKEGDQAQTAVSCLSSTIGPRLSAVRATAELPRFLSASPQFGRAFADTLVMCTHWPVPSSQPARAIHARGAAPILVIGTTRDPATPYPQAVALAGQLESGRLLTRVGDGHTGYHRGNACVDRTVDRFLLRGTLPPAGAVCR